MYCKVFFSRISWGRRVARRILGCRIGRRWTWIPLVRRRDILLPVIKDFSIFTFFIFSQHEWNSIGLLMPFINFWRR
jgi:hypothetical protein